MSSADYVFGPVRINSDSSARFLNFEKKNELDIDKSMISEVKKK